MSQRVPVLLKRGLVRLVVVDSVAALFRSEFQADEAIKRSRHLLTFSSALHRLSHCYGAPVLCVNQVRRAQSIKLQCVSILYSTVYIVDTCV